MLSCPLYLGFTLKPVIEFHQEDKTILSDVYVCTDSRSKAEVYAFTAVRCVVQFVLPLLMVLGYYAKIYFRLRGRPLSQHPGEHRRRRRTNLLLLSITVGFFLS